MKPRLQDFYEKKVRPELQSELGLKNLNQVPRLEKIVVSMCLKEAATDIKVMEKAMEQVAMITGQKPKMTRAKKAIANFKLRKGVPLGCMATLRGPYMFEFFDRLANVALPRVRDFQGVPSRGFDGKGNYSLGLKEQIIFPEIEHDKIDTIRGMNVTIVTTAQSDESGRALLEKMGIPFRKR